MWQYINVDFVQSNSLTAGPKAREDVSKILYQLGYRLIKFVFSKKRILATFFSLCSALWRISYKSKILLQYPVGNIYGSLIVLMILKLKRCDITILIHDVVSFRFNGKMSLCELLCFKLADNLIVHTENMKEILMSAINPKKMFVLNLFDYLVDILPPDKERNDKSIVFAGNLDKSPFVMFLKDTPLPFSLYGTLKCEEGICNKRIKYNGVFQASDLSGLRGAWGLVWDGDSLDSCTGMMGNYQKINAPHKLSLYIAAGIPVIIWKQSAERVFVEKNKIGFSVNSIWEIEGVLNNLTDRDYKEMVDNVNVISVKIRNGEMLLNVLSTINPQ